MSLKLRESKDPVKIAINLNTVTVLQFGHLLHMGNWNFLVKSEIQTG